MGHEPTAVDPEMVDHLTTYHGFLSLTKWAIIHLAILVVALYCLIIAHNVAFGILMLVVSIALLVYGVVRRPAVQEDFAPSSGAHA